MADTTLVAKQPATAWGAVLGGWLATLGASVVIAPLVAGLIAAAGTSGSSSDLALAVPVVLGLLVSYTVGGYVAGRMAGYRTSWHGMMTAFFTLFVLLVILLVGGLADRGIFAASGITSLRDVVPGMRDLNVDSVGNALSFGAILGFLAAIFGGWLGGLLAPSSAIPVTAVAPAPVTQVTRTETKTVERPRHTLIPAFGHKGGERVEEKVDEVHTSRVDRV
jgi:hypothetical protein